MTDDTVQAAAIILLLVLPLSGLIARRVPFFRLLLTALAWVGIFAIGLLLVGGGDRFGPQIGKLRDTMLGREQSVVGDTVRIRMSPDGHFWANVRINGVARRMLIDSGATITAMSTATATAAALDLDASPFPAILMTANGRVSARNAVVDRMEVGDIVARDLSVVVSGAFGETNVLGMNFLSRLKSWRVEGRVLIMEPKTEV